MDSNQYLINQPPVRSLQVCFAGVACWLGSQPRVAPGKLLFDLSDAFYHWTIRPCFVTSVAGSGIIDDKVMCRWSEVNREEGVMGTNSFTMRQPDIFKNVPNRQNAISKYISRHLYAIWCESISHQVCHDMRVCSHSWYRSFLHWLGTTKNLRRWPPWPTPVMTYTCHTSVLYSVMVVLYHSPNFVQLWTRHIRSQESTSADQWFHAAL